MTFRSHTKQTREFLGEVTINAELGPQAIKSLSRSMAEDAENYEAHLSMKSEPDYKPPVFPDAKLERGR